MTDLALTDDLFFTKTGMDRARVEKIVAEALHGMDDGELFLEYSQSESLTLDDGRIKSASFDTAQGFGLRGISDEAAGYAHASELSEDAIRRAGQAVRAVRQGHSGTFARAAARHQPPALYRRQSAASGRLRREDQAPRRDRRLCAEQGLPRQTGLGLALRHLAGGADHPLRRPARRRYPPAGPDQCDIVVGDGDKMESGTSGAGGRLAYERFIDPANWKAQVDEALRQALVNLDSVPAPAGEMPVVLGPGWPGVMLHEAVGHGLEGDFNRKKTSAFAGLIGQRVASPGVTVVDDGTIPDRRGSLSVDDEGTPSNYTVLIEDGILKDYMQDRLNARLMGMKPTGNGRRESFAYAPMPRMTNTYMLAGDKDPKEIIASVKRGLYAVNFGGGQVDITSGKFVFSASEAYLIEDGKVGKAVKGATLIGNGPDAMTKVSMIGNDLALDGGIGTCGKDGQGVPVGVGQPTLRMDGLTVGGTAA